MEKFKSSKFLLHTYLDRYLSIKEHLKVRKGYSEIVPGLTKRLSHTPLASVY